jgi:methylamine dehydrogenase accessory protein MauD
MESILTLSHIVLWLLVLTQFLFIAALARQIGVIHVRLWPAGARIMNPGPQVGQAAPPLNTSDVFGNAVTMGAERGKRTLIVFISTQCPVCKDILPNLKTLTRTEGDELEVILVIPNENIEIARRFVSNHRLERIPLTTSTDLVSQYQIGVTPYAVMVDHLGIVRAKGLINNAAQVESLLTATDAGYASIQSYMDTQESLVGEEAAMQKSHA